MKVINILKKLHKKVTGTEIEKNSVTEILESLEENYNEQSSSSSGNGDYIVHINEIQENGQTILKADKSITDIIAAKNNNQLIECIYQNQHYNYTGAEDDSTVFFNTTMMFDDTYITYYNLTGSIDSATSKDSWAFSGGDKMFETPFIISIDMTAIASQEYELEYSFSELFEAADNIIAKLDSLDVDSTINNITFPTGNSYKLTQKMCSDDAIYLSDIIPLNDGLSPCLLTLKIMQGDNDTAIGTLTAKNLVS